MTKALLTLLVAPAAVLSFTATPPPLYRTPAPLRPALHPRSTGHVYGPAMMALPGREAADAASPGKIRRVINFFKSPFTRNKETGALETPQVVDVEARAQVRVHVVVVARAVAASLNCPRPRGWEAREARKGTRGRARPGRGPKPKLTTPRHAPATFCSPPTAPTATFP